MNRVRSRPASLHDDADRAVSSGIANIGFGRVAGPCRVRRGSVLMAAMFVACAVSGV
jgi:hypothetical protein